MKKELINLLKRYKYKLLIEFIAMITLVYLTTCTSKYLGKIIDLLSDIPNNQQLIIQNVILMILSCIGLLIDRIIFKKIDFSIQICGIKTLKDHLFQKFLKIRLEDIKSIKNGEIMSYFVRDSKKL